MQQNNGLYISQYHSCHNFLSIKAPLPSSVITAIKSWEEESEQLIFSVFSTVTFIEIHNSSKLLLFGTVLPTGFIPVKTTEAS